MYTVSIFCYFALVDKFNVCRNLSEVMLFTCRHPFGMWIPDKSEICLVRLETSFRVDWKKENKHEFNFVPEWYWMNHFGTALQGGRAKLAMFKRKTSCLERLDLFGWSLLGVGRCNWKTDWDVFFPTSSFTKEEKLDQYLWEWSYLLVTAKQKNVAVERDT